MAGAPYQRTIEAGISLPMARASNAGCPAYCRTVACSVRSMVRARRGSSRNVTCCGHANPASRRSPWSAAMSSSQTGGAVYVRTALKPVAAICAKSRRTVAGAGYSMPPAVGRKVPYVTPRTQSLVSPT